jgi:hypothetical protein
VLRPSTHGTPGSDGQGRMARRIATPKSSSYLLFSMR